MNSHTIQGNIHLTFPNNFIDKIIFNAVSKIGYYLIPDWRLRTIPLVSHLAQIFQRHKIDCVIDIGANSGQFGLFLIEQLRYQGKIISLEPITSFYEELKLTAKNYPNWEVFNYAIAEVDGPKEINVMKSGVLSSFHNPDTTTLPEYKAGTQISRTETVNCLTLKSFINQHNISLTKTFIKSDTQGYESLVIESLSELISEVPAIMAEISVHAYYRNVVSYLEVIKMMEGKDFSLSNLIQGAVDNNIRAVEYDAIFINNKFLSE